MTKLKQLAAATDLSAPARRWTCCMWPCLALRERLRQLMMQTPGARRHRVLGWIPERMIGHAKRPSSAWQRHAFSRSGARCRLAWVMFSG